MPHTIVEIAEPACAAQEFDGEVIALNLEKGTYYSLRAMSAVLWRDLAAGHPVEALVALAGDAAQQVRDFVATLTTEGLLRPASGAAATAAPAFAEAIANGVPIALNVEVYDDMNSLILLDPVHDIDTSKGWPSLPPDRPTDA